MQKSCHEIQQKKNCHAFFLFMHLNLMNLWANTGTPNCETALTLHTVQAK